jgi:signal transduction histidine kinase
MKKVFIISFFFCVVFPFLSVGQIKKIDSLQAVLKTQKEDTSKVNTWNALVYELSEARSNIQELEKNAEEALRLAEKLNYKKGIADSYVRFAAIAIGKGDYHERIKKCFAALKIYEEIMNKPGMADCYTCLSVGYSRMGNSAEALRFALERLKVITEMGDKNLLIGANNLVAGFYKGQSRFSEANKYFLTSLNISKEAGDKFGCTIRCMSIAGVYSLQGNYSEALNYYSLALTYAKEYENKSLIANVHAEIGNFYSDQSNFPEAVKNYQLALKLREEIGNKEVMTYSYNEIGKFYSYYASQMNDPDSSGFKQKLFSEAHAHLLNGHKLAEQINSKEYLFILYQSIGDCYANQLNFSDAAKNYLEAFKITKEMGRNLQAFDLQVRLGCAYTELKKFAEAKQFLTDALNYAQKNSNKIGIKTCYEYLSQLDEAMENWKEANQNYKSFIVYRDSLENKENSEKIVRMQMQYDFGKKEDSLNYTQALTSARLKQQTLLSQQQEQTILLKEKEITLFENEKELQQLKTENDLAAFAAQKAEADNKQGQLILLNKEKDIQSLELSKQKQIKKYLFAGFGLLLVLAFFVYRNYQTRQQLKLQTLRNKIASDLHDDIGSTLSSISIFSQMAQQQSKEVIPMLETIGENSRKMLDSMADIVWTINPENDEFEKIVLRMRSFAYELLGAKNIDFEFNADDDITKAKLTMDVRKNLYLIFKEATNNMVKYSGADKATFSIKGEKNYLTMLIRDNGKGFDTKQSPNGNGLKNMKKRAEEIGAWFMIDSLPGNGTTIELKIAI